MSAVKDLSFMPTVGNPGQTAGKYCALPVVVVKPYQLLHVASPTNV